MGKKKNRYKCSCLCGCSRTPGCRRVECSNCGYYVCPGYCLALDELEVCTEGVNFKLSLCRRCVSDRIICNGLPYYPDASLHELIIAYVQWNFLQACLLYSECYHDDEWHVV